MVDLGHCPANPYAMGAPASWVAAIWLALTSFPVIGCREHCHHGLWSMGRPDEYASRPHHCLSDYAIVIPPSACSIVRSP